MKIVAKIETDDRREKSRQSLNRTVILYSDSIVSLQLSQRELVPRPALYCSVDCSRDNAGESYCISQMGTY